MGNSKRNQKLVIRISKEEVRQKPRSEIKKSVSHRDRTKYSRKVKHPLKK